MERQDKKYNPYNINVSALCIVINCSFIGFIVNAYGWVLALILSAIIMGLLHLLTKQVEKKVRKDIEIEEKSNP